MEITINALYNNSRIFNADNEVVTIADLCAHASVVEWFEAEPADIKDSLMSVHSDIINAPSITDSNFETIINLPLMDGMTLNFDMEAKEVQEEATDETENNPENAIPTRGEEGIVTVYTSGGLQSTIVHITVGVTTVHEAIFNDTVRARSGMTDTQLSSCNINLNEVQVQPGELSTRVLASGDTITLHPRSASTKGC